MKFDFYEDAVLDATTLLKFRHLIKSKEASRILFDKINSIFEQNGLIMHGGTIIDATIIEEPIRQRIRKGEGIMKCILAMLSMGILGYMGIEKQGEIVGSETLKNKEYRICKNMGKTRTVIFRWTDVREGSRKSSIRRKVEFDFCIMKCKFGFKKTNYRGIKKNLNCLYMIFAYANILMIARAERLQNILKHSY